MEKKGYQGRREAGKNPAMGRSAGRGEGSSARGASKGRSADQGVDLRALDQLAEAGMLSAEGKRLKESMRSGLGSPVRVRPEAREGFGSRRDGAAPRGRREEGEGRREERPKLRRTTAPVAVKRPVGPQGPERLHKVMAQAGLASRRHSEELIQAGRVTVNGQVVTQLGTKVTPGKDLIEIDGRPLGKAEEPIYILLNKPKGYVTTLFDPQGRKKVTDLLAGEIGQRVYPVGRLDYDTEGLLLLTNDGELANALMHPSQQIKKTYIAKVRGVPNTSKITQLEQGIELEDGITAPADVKLIEAHGPNAASLSIRIHEGRNRQVRRMFEAVGHEVISLRRTTMGPLHLKSLKVGEWRYLSPNELLDLRSAVGDKVAARGAYIAEMAARRGKGRPEPKGAPVESAEARPTRPAFGGPKRADGAPAGLGRPTRLGGDQGYGTKPFTRPARGEAPARSEGFKPLGRPTREGGAARFDREEGAQAFGRPVRNDAPKPLGRPVRNDGAKPLGRPTREGGAPRFDREQGNRSFGRPAREEGGRPTREGGAKPYARPAKSFFPRPDEGGPRPTGPRRRP